MLVALVTIPLLIDGMGKERFGLLAIIWMGVGYFSLFDMGLGRALTKMVSERLGRGEQAGLGSLIWTAFALLAVFGAVGAIVLGFLSPALVTGLLQIPVDLHGEAIIAFRILAIGIPFVIITAGIVGLLQAHQRFGTITAIRVPLGILTFAGPLITLQFTPSIAWATTALLVARLLALFTFYIVSTKVRPEMSNPEWLTRSHIRPLLSYGGWLTVTNIIGPLMTYLDRFFIGTMLGLTAVAYYVTPYEVLSRLQILPQALMGVLFPAMATAHSGDRKRLLDLYVHSSKLIYWSILPMTSCIFLLGPEALLIWLGEDFRQASTPVVYWLATGWMINALARPAFTILQSAGRPDLVAKSHLVELLPYLGLLWGLAESYGIVGVAAAWTLRVAADTVILNVLAAFHLPILRNQVLRTCWVAMATVGLFGAYWLIEPLTLRVVVIVTLIGMAVLVLWPIARKAMKGGLSSGAARLDKA
jgi:O-antigen/teichoic acid export membrane protein